MQIRELHIRMGAIWLGSLPPSWVFKATHFKEWCLDGVESSDNRAVRAVCLRLHLGGRHRSGVLGVEFVPENTNQLAVRIGVLECTDKDVYAGLPSAFADIVLDNVIAMTADVKLLGAGCLRFECASWHRLYSDKIVFSLLTRSLILLLNSDWETASEDRVTEIIMKAGESMRREIDPNEGK